MNQGDLEAHYLLPYATEERPFGNYFWVEPLQRTRRVTPVVIGLHGT